LLAFAQVPAASPPPQAAAGAPAAYSAAELEKLVGPFALYPDDLVAIILPASTFPLEIVQADRFLDKRKADPKAQVEASWDDSVKSLVNYPEVVKKMSKDLDWTQDLGEAVVANNGAVMEAVQAFRRKAQGAGSLKSDTHQTVVVEQQVIKIEPTDPQVVYVPQYEPSQVVVYGSPYAYPYSAPNPAYWYPYAPGAALAAGVIWGAAMGAIWGGGRYGANYGGGNNNITINRGNNNVNTGNIGSGNRGGGNSTWKSTKQPGQVGTAGNRQQGGRVGDAGGGRSGAGGVGGAGGAGGAGGRGGDSLGAGGGGRPVSSTRPSGGGGGDAFGGMDSGAGANRASSRGNESRASSSGGARASTGSAGGGGRSSGGFSGGGGGGRGGGGGGGRGGGGGGRR
jgi:hypothetical protein